MNKVMEPDQVYKRVIKTAEKVDELILKEMKTIRPSQRLLIAGRVISLVFYRHFNMVMRIGSEIQMDREEKAANSASITKGE